MSSSEKTLTEKKTFTKSNGNVYYMCKYTMCGSASVYLLTKYLCNCSQC